MNPIQIIVVELANISDKSSTTVTFMRGGIWRKYKPGHESCARLNTQIRLNEMSVASAYPHRLRIAVFPNGKEEETEIPF